jgi:uncharacterized membrane protein
MTAIIVSMTALFVVMFAWLNRVQKALDEQSARLAQARIALLVMSEAIDRGDSGSLLKTTSEELMRYDA